MYGHDYTWAVSPATDDDYYFAAAAVAGAGALTLLKTNAGPNGVGYRVWFDSVGNSSARTWTIVGHKMGTPYGTSTTESVTAPNATTGSSVNYYDSITSITASGAMTGDQKVGINGTTVALPATRIIGVHWVGAASAGYILVNRNSATGAELLRINTPASATIAAYAYTGGIRTAGGNAETDFALVSVSNVSLYTLICG